MTTAAPELWFERRGVRAAFADRFAGRALGRRILAGILGGIFAGACMMVLAVLYLGKTAGDWWLAPRLIDATFGGVQALIGGTGAIVAGLFIHAFVAITWAVVFALLVPRRAWVWTALGAGVAWGFAVWVAMTYFVLPWADPTMEPRAHFVMPLWIALHVVYGAALVVVPLLVRALTPRVLPPPVVVTEAPAPRTAAEDPASPAST